MSGRVKVTLASGRKVTGYRKTDRERAPETRGVHRAEPWVLSFVCPPELLLSPGRTGVIGVDVTAPGPMLTASGVNREWIFVQMRMFLDRIKAPEFKIMAVCRRVGEHQKSVVRYLTYTPGKPLEWGRE